MSQSFGFKVMEKLSASQGSDIGCVCVCVRELRASGVGKDLLEVRFSSCACACACLLRSMYGSDLKFLHLVKKRHSRNMDINPDLKLTLCSISMLSNHQFPGGYFPPSE